MCSCQLAFRASGVFPLQGHLQGRSLVYHQSWLLSRFPCISFGNCFLFTFAHNPGRLGRELSATPWLFRMRRFQFFHRDSPSWSFALPDRYIRASTWLYHTETPTESVCGKRWKKEENHMRKESCILIESWDYTAGLNSLTPDRLSEFDGTVSWM